MTFAFKAAERPPAFFERGKVSLNSLLLLFGTAVLFAFVVAAIGHGYVDLRLIPSLPYLHDEAAGVLLACALASFNYLAFSTLFSRSRATWSWGRTFVGVCSLTILTLELILILGGIVKRNVGDTYIENAAMHITNLIERAKRIDEDMTHDYKNQLRGLQESITRSERGDDGSRIARCGRQCKERTQQRDDTERKYGALSQRGTYSTPADGAADLSSRFDALTLAMQTLGARVSIFGEFANAANIQSPSLLAYQGLARDVADFRRELLGNDRQFSEHALILRLTADTISRCLSMRGSVHDYVSMVIALALVLLLPAYAVMRRELGKKVSAIHEEVEKVRDEADAYSELSEALVEKNKRKLMAVLRGEAWSKIAT